MTQDVSLSSSFEAAYSGVYFAPILNLRGDSVAFVLHGNYSRLRRPHFYKTLT